jgi:hypothetical protein
MKKMARTGLWLMLLVFAVPMMAVAQDDAIQAPPTYVVGDKWVYDGGFDSLEDAKAGKNSKWNENQMTTRIVREVNDKTIVIANPKGNRSYVYDKNLNLLERHVNGVDTFYKPLWGPIYKYPMQPGNKYNVEFSYNRPDGLYHNVSATVKVIGWETVTVPAGTFRALKIKMEGLSNYQFTTSYGTIGNDTMYIEEIIWFAPEIKRHVLYLYESNWWGGQQQLYYESLKSYSVK